MDTHSGQVAGKRVRHVGRERGFALPAAMFALIVMSVIAAAAVQLSMTDRQATWASVEGERAHYAAEAGAHRIWANWPAGSDALAPGDSLDLGWTTLPDRSRYRGVITRVDSGTVQELRVLRVQGRSAGPSGGQRIVELWSTQGANLFPSAVGARGNLLITNEALVDSYDSGVGPYGGPNVNTNGDVHANGNVDITNNSTVEGAASATGVTTTATGGVATQGTSSGAASKKYPPAYCPGGGYTKAAALPPGLYSYNEVTGNLIVDNTVLLLPAGTYHFNNVTVSKAASNLGPILGQNVTIHIGGTLTMGQQGKINLNGRPPEMMIYGCGPTLHTWSMNQNSLAWAALYAPQDDIVVENDSDVFGAVVGRNVTIWKGGSGPVSVHYDEQLGGLAAGGARRQMLRPWAQIAR